MGTTFRPYHPDQMLLLPQDLREWVAEGHLAHHVSDLVDALDLSAFYAPRGGRARSADDGQGSGLRVRDGDVLVAEAGKEAGGGHRVSDAGGGELSAAPDAVRVPPAHLDDFGAVFAEMVRLARGMGLAGLGRVSVDGTKVRANGKRKAMSYGRMTREERRLRAEIAGLLEKAEAVDAARMRATERTLAGTSCRRS